MRFRKYIVLNIVVVANQGMGYAVEDMGTYFNAIDKSTLKEYHEWFQRSFVRFLSLFERAGL